MKEIIPITAGVEAVALAQALAFLEGRGERVSSRNDLIRLCVHLVGSQVEKEPTLEEAHRMLDERLPVRSYKEGRRVRERARKVGKLEEYNREEMKEFEKAQALASQFGRSLTWNEFKANMG